MANQTVENQENKEINGYKSANELATALDEKNKELANKIRSFAEKQIVSDSQNWRLQLKEELTPSEQKEIREAIPSEAKNFDKGMTDGEKVMQEASIAATGIIPSGGKAFEEKLSKLDSFGSLFDQAEEVYKKVAEAKGGIAGTFAGIMAAIMYFLTGKTPEGIEFSWNKKGEKKEGGNKIDAVKGAEYILGLKALYLISGKELTKESNNTLQSPQFQNTNFFELEKEYTNKSGIASRLGFTQEQSNDDTVYSTITLLLKSEKGLNNILSKENPNWKTAKLIDIMTLLNKKGGGVLSNMKDKVEKIEFSGFNPISNVSLALGHLKNMLEVNVNGEDIDFGGLSEKRHLLDNVSKSTQAKIFISGNNSWIKKSSQSAETVNNLAGNGSDEDKKFIEKVFSYKDKIIQPLINLFPKDEQGKATSFFNEKGITFKELTELYLITGGNPDINSIDGISKTLLYIKIFGILSRDNTSGLSGSFAKELYDQLIDEKNLTIPEETKNILNNILKSAIEKTMEGAKGLLIDTYKLSDTSTKLIVGSVLAGYVAWILFGGRFRIFTQAVGTVSTAAAITYIYSKFMEDPKASKYLKEKGITETKFKTEAEKITSAQ